MLIYNHQNQINVENCNSKEINLQDSSVYRKKKQKKLGKVRTKLLKFITERSFWDIGRNYIGLEHKSVTL